MSTNRSGNRAASIADFLPQAPGWLLDWEGIDQAFPWVRAMRGGRHDPIHHQEGDVWVHTRMVCEALVALDEWRGLPADDRFIGFAAALLHDVTKPQTAREENGRITNRGHSISGAIEARIILWKMGVAPRLREQVCAIIRRHQIPFYLIEKPVEEARRILARQSLAGSNRLLALVAQADALGRICEDPERILTNVGLFRELAREEACFDAAFPFADDATRFAYFTRANSSIDPRWSISLPEAPVAVMMSGLPGSGKSTWIRQHAGDRAVISLDAVRELLDIDAGDNQGAVQQYAREAMREEMRRGRSFVFDATNLSASIRQAYLGLWQDYGYRTAIVAIEAPYRDLLVQNAERDSPIPNDSLHRLFQRWDHPDPSETYAHVSQAYGEACRAGVFGL